MVVRRISLPRRPLQHRTTGTLGDVACGLSGQSMMVFVPGRPINKET
jgi:hypothetical protein